MEKSGMRGGSLSAITTISLLAPLRRERKIRLWFHPAAMLNLLTKGVLKDERGRDFIMNIPRAAFVF